MTTDPHAPHLSVVLVLGPQLGPQREASATGPDTLLADLTVRLLGRSLTAAGVSHEFILVRWNASADPTGPVWPTLRTVTVPPATVAAAYPDRTTHWFEGIARNIGIRRARGAWILTVTPGVVLSSALLQTLLGCIQGDHGAWLCSHTAHLAEGALPATRQAAEVAAAMAALEQALPDTAVARTAAFVAAHANDRPVEYLAHALRLFTGRRWLAAPRSFWHAVRGLPEWRYRPENLGWIPLLLGLNCGLPVRLIALDKAHWQLPGPPPRAPDGTDALHILGQAPGPDGDTAPQRFTVLYVDRWLSPNRVVGLSLGLEATGHLSGVRVGPVDDAPDGGAPFDAVVEGTPGRFAGQLQVNGPDWGAAQLPL